MARVEAFGHFEMTTFFYSGDNWSDVISRAVRGRPEFKFDNCERLQLRLLSKRNDLQRLEDLGEQVEDDAEDARGAIRDNIFDAILNAAGALAVLGSLLLALNRFRSIIRSLRRLLDNRNLDNDNLARILAELGALLPAVGAVLNITRALESSRSFNRLKSRAESLAQDARRVQAEIESIANELDRECFSSARNVG